MIHAEVRSSLIIVTDEICCIYYSLVHPRPSEEQGVVYMALLHYYCSTNAAEGLKMEVIFRIFWH